MTQWYYADAQRQRQGPVDTDTLVARLSQGLVDRRSLVWREGLPQWVTLGDVAAELGLDAPLAASAPPAADPAAVGLAKEGAPVAGTSTADATEQDWSQQATPVVAKPDAPAEPAPAAASAPVAPATASPLPGSRAEDPLQTALHPDAAQPLSGASGPAGSQSDASWSSAADATAPLPTSAAASPRQPPSTTTPLPTAWDTPAGSAPFAGSAAPDAAVVYAGLWRRVAASILDSLVTTFAVYLIVIPLVFLLAFSAGMSDAGAALDDGSAFSIALLVLAYGIGLAIPTLYFAWMQSSRLQASLGKLACGIKVVRADSHGARVGFWRNLLRYVAYMLISVLTLGIGVIVAAFMAGMSARKQAPHDKVCKTLVVDRWAFTDHPERQSKGLDTVSIVVLVIYAVLLVLSIVVGALVMATIGMSRS
ncbi:RDD family protein [Xanthomonas cucurbitae]|uniref:RDD family protein n=1 Tax=Xanthomonas cucurbitae TaxID=56453 RepID=A0A2S7DQ96_9XANT|nr:RDD family protein [Xanthomonas cucurbitae]PPU76003.1 RDD family protein [Xanthomonas cucurbitae]WDM78831.1 RDD family protein [Xanthomonas cucurbitae]WDM82511.1 RDD family protein [Xanthomonas cucurbitae]